MKIVINISNSLSLFRIVLSIPLAYFLINFNIYIILAIAALGIVTDYLDGIMARKLNQITEFGKILDPLADKIFFTTAALIMIYQDMIPDYFAIILILRDVLIFLGGVYIKKKTGIVPDSNMTGKIAVNLVTIVLLGILLNINGFYEYGSLIASLFLVYSFIIYVIRGKNFLK